MSDKNLIEATWMGRPLSELSKEELLKVVGYLIKKIESAKERVEYERRIWGV